MTTFTISLPDQLAEAVDKETVTRGFATRSEFFRDLLRRFFPKVTPMDSFVAYPLKQMRNDMEKSGKYKKAFIDSVIAGLSKSSAYADTTSSK